MLLELFVKLIYSILRGKCMVLTFLENTLNLGIFSHTTTPSPTLNYPSSSYHHTLSRNKLIMPLGSIFLKYFTQTQAEADETMVCFIRIKSENMKMTSNFRLFRFCMICSFFQIWWFYSFVYNPAMYYAFSFIVSPFQPFYFDTEITSEKNSYFDEGWLFIGRLKVRSVPERVNKEVLAQFVHKPA